MNLRLSFTSDFAPGSFAQVSTVLMTAVQGGILCFSRSRSKTYSPDRRRDRRGDDRRRVTPSPPADTKRRGGAGGVGGGGGGGGVRQR